VNFKLLFPTFRNRYRFVRTQLKRLEGEKTFQSGLNLGTGEGDYDAMVAQYCVDLIACDVNEADLAHARRINKGVMNLHYEYNNALSLTYANNSFDLLVSCEVIEHVGQPARMVQEIGRVLEPGGIAILTFPSREFPITYDPINRFWQWFRGKNSQEWLISQGAYAFGHEYLISSADFKQWAADAGLEIVEFQGLSRHLTGLAEVYWTGIAQSIFKKNARNVPSDSASNLTVRPNSVKEPTLTIITDSFLWIDQLLFGWTNRSIGKGVVLQKSSKTNI